jgi:aromatic-amino-acid transaminase
MTNSSVFSAIEMAPRDPILGITEAFNADTNPAKINLGVGVYYDDNGKVPLLKCVEKAEAILIEQHAPRTYLPIEGLAAYDKAVQELVFGADSAVIQEKRAVTVRTENRRRLPEALLAGFRGLHQQPELGKPPRTVRKRRLQSQQLRLL